MSPLSIWCGREFVQYSDIDNGRIIVYNVIAISMKEEMHMSPNLGTEDALTELNIIREKIEAVLNCLNRQCKRA
jgi:hypothetical protein